MGFPKTPSSELGVPNPGVKNLGNMSFPIVNDHHSGAYLWNFTSSPGPQLNALIPPSQTVLCLQFQRSLNEIIHQFFAYGSRRAVLVKGLQRGVSKFSGFSLANFANSKGVTFALGAPRIGGSLTHSFSKKGL